MFKLPFKLGIFKRINRLLANVGFEIIQIPKPVKKIYSDVFHSKYPKKVLISYIKETFVKEPYKIHSNWMECYTAGLIFHELGYRVDAVDLWDEVDDYSGYDIVYGQGNALENSFKSNCPNQMRIFYGTGCSSIYSNIVTSMKVREFYDEYNVLLPNLSRKITISQDFQTLLSDAVIVLGGNSTLKSYTDIDNNIERYHNLNGFYFDTYDIDLTSKDFTSAKKHYLWFGGYGLLHKGLDVLLKIFLERSSLVLHICGAPESEYKPLLKCFPKAITAKNIINHGFVNIESKEFKKLMDQCSFIVFPSLSEGGCVSVVNVMANGGLIPIVSESTGLDIAELGQLLPDCSYTTFAAAIDASRNLSIDEMKSSSVKVKENIRNSYSYHNYRNALKEHLQHILVTHNKRK